MGRPAEYYIMTNSEGHTVKAHPVDVIQLKEAGYTMAGEIVVPETADIVPTKSLVPKRRGKQ